ncbi:hypothetical protein ACVRY7_10550 [Streptococcus ictaluri]|uniref:Uncharacterized protein n=1 Tax=Streptococcus ictaluri 707-05 TaxID=764299 RepID=G5K1V0_9STRE|nr:hypothetical protein [Streptococcus ictaluri]EHI70289.1 hypothetical protein STRIC_2358 [Streptococcus ictaluri 707-05]
MSIAKLITLLWKIEGVTFYNQRIYRLQKLPLIGKRIPNRFYHAATVKGLLLLIHIFSSPLKILTLRLCYVVLCLGLGQLTTVILAEYRWYQKPDSLSQTLTYFIIFSLLLSPALSIKLFSVDDVKQIKAIRQFHILPRDYFQANQLLSFGQAFLFHSFTLGLFLAYFGFAFWHGISFTLLVLGLNLGLKCLFLPLYQVKKSKKEDLLNKAILVTHGAS